MAQVARHFEVRKLDRKLAQLKEGQGGATAGAELLQRRKAAVKVRPG